MAVVEVVVVVARENEEEKMFLRKINVSFVEITVTGLPIAPKEMVWASPVEGVSNAEIKAILQENVIIIEKDQPRIQEVDQDQEADDLILVQDLDHVHTQDLNLDLDPVPTKKERRESHTLAQNPIPDLAPDQEVLLKAANIKAELDHIPDQEASNQIMGE